MQQHILELLQKVETLLLFAQCDGTKLTGQAKEEIDSTLNKLTQQVEYYVD